MIALITGAVAGLIHVFAGPDHLAAVAPLAADKTLRSWKVGFRWGIGHASGVLVVGIVSLLLREVLPIERLSSWSERFIGLVLIAIGLWGLRKTYASRVHTHAHTHDGETHVHIHVHAKHAAHPHRHSRKLHQHTHAAFAVGTLHGLAGSSHIFGILPALAFPTRWQASSYLLAYGVGTIAAMTTFSSLIGMLSSRLSMGGPRAYQLLMGSCSLAAVFVGVFWLAA